MDGSPRRFRLPASSAEITPRTWWRGRSEVQRPYGYLERRPRLPLETPALILLVLAASHAVMRCLYRAPGRVALHGLGCNPVEAFFLGTWHRRCPAALVRENCGPPGPAVRLIDEPAESAVGPGFCGVFRTPTSNIRTLEALPFLATQIPSDMPAILESPGMIDVANQDLPPRDTLWCCCIRSASPQLGV